MFTSTDLSNGGANVVANSQSMERKIKPINKDFLEVTPYTNVN